MVKIKCAMNGEVVCRVSGCPSTYGLEELALR